MQPITNQPHLATFPEVVLPDHANHCGALNSSNALQMMGRAAFVCATRHARGPVVMAKADSIEFRRPIQVGSVIDIRARIVFEGQFSMTVIVEIRPDDAGSPQVAPAISGRFMMVAVDDAGVPTPIRSSNFNHTEEAVS